MVSTTEIAKYAGVSQTTVSRVLNKPDQVKKETYEKVMAAIHEWGYSTEPKERTDQPNAVKTIRILAAANDPVIFNGAIPAIANDAIQQGLFVNIHLDVPGKRDTLFDELVSEGTAGVIVSSVPVEDQLVEKLTQLNIPFVLLNTEHPDSHYSIVMNNEEAGYSAASRLIETGHQEIAWIGGPLTAQTNKDGLLGFVQALQANKHKIRKKRLVVTEMDKVSLYKAFDSLLALKKKPTAVVAATGEIALQLMDFCQAAGWKVPENVSIIGLGNSEAASQAIGISSVGMAASHEELGQEAISMLLHAVRSENAEPRHVKKEVELFERHTTLPLLNEKQSK